jgi:trans-2-enoyl-CoA reductase
MSTPTQTPAASASRHTPEPWFVCGNVSGCGVATEIGTVSGQRIASVGDHHFRASGENKFYHQIYANNGFEVAGANAERVVSCVNALAGLNPDGVKDVADALTDSIDTLHADVLCAQHVAHLPGMPEIIQTKMKRLAFARSALAKLKGAQ